MSNFKQSRQCTRGHWKSAEDAKLKELVAQFGPHHWNLIADKLHGRSGKSCRLRWFNQLDPRINRRPFTEDEEDRLLAVHGVYGNKWAMFSRFFPGRTDNTLKNHWHLIMAKKRKDRCKSYHREKKPCSEFNSQNECKISKKITPLLHFSDGRSFESRTPLYHEGHEFQQQSGNLGGFFLLSSAPVNSNATEFKSDFGRNYEESESSFSVSSTLLSSEGENICLNADLENKSYDSDDSGMTVKGQFIDFLGVGDT